VNIDIPHLKSIEVVEEILDSWRKMKRIHFVIVNSRTGLPVALKILEKFCESFQK
jgi:hypothetical protein